MLSQGISDPAIREYRVGKRRWTGKTRRGKNAEEGNAAGKRRRDRIMHSKWFLRGRFGDWRFRLIYDTLKIHIVNWFLYKSCGASTFNPLILYSIYRSGGNKCNFASQTMNAEAKGHQTGSQRFLRQIMSLSLISPFRWSNANAAFAGFMTRRLVKTRVLSRRRYKSCDVSLFCNNELFDLLTNGKYRV